MNFYKDKINSKETYDFFNDYIDDLWTSELFDGYQRLCDIEKEIKNNPHELLPIIDDVIRTLLERMKDNDICDRCGGKVDECLCSYVGVDDYYEDTILEE